MSSVTRPKGPLPPRVYWTRRLLVVAVSLAIVFGLGRVLGGEPGGSGPVARPAAADATQATKSAAPAAQPTDRSTAPSTADAQPAPKPKAKAKAKKTPLAVPTGACADDDVKITPSVDKPVAGSDVTITLNLTTLQSPACNWVVSPESAVLKLTSGSDRIWSTQDCPSAIKEQAVVVRKGHQTKVSVVWSGQRSDDECSRTTLWAQPGYYHASAAALGAEPVDTQFELASPPRPTITPSPKPEKRRD